MVLMVTLCGRFELVVLGGDDDRDYSLLEVYSVSRLGFLSCQPTSTQSESESESETSSSHKIELSSANNSVVRLPLRQLLSNRSNYFIGTSLQRSVITAVLLIQFNSERNYVNHLGLDG